MYPATGLPRKLPPITTVEAGADLWIAPFVALTGALLCRPEPVSFMTNDDGDDLIVSSAVDDDARTRPDESADRVLRRYSRVGRASRESRDDGTAERFITQVQIL